MNPSTFYRRYLLVSISFILLFNVHAQDGFKPYGSTLDYCEPPKNLIAESYLGGPAEVSVNWESPYLLSEWLRYDDGVNLVGIAAGSEFWFAARWTADQLPENEMCKLHSVQYFPKGTITSLSLKVWQGANAANLIYEEEINSINYDEWNTIILQTPVHINVNEELWVGFRMISSAEGAGVGEYSGSPNSDLYSQDGTTWQNLTDLGMNYSWNLSVHIFNNETPDNLLGYNLFRNESQINDELIQDTNYLDFIPVNDWACYKATTVYSDCGESVLSNESCVTISGVNDDDLYSSSRNNKMILKVLPNPIKNFATIKFDGLQNQHDLKLHIVDILGNMSFDSILQSGQTEISLNTHNWEKGVYIVQIYSGKKLVGSARFVKI